jgi:two-component system OmpR family sensor kinase/two-component system sensor histidine kinase BaeS
MKNSVELKKKLIYWMVAVVTIAILTVGATISYWTHHLFKDYVDQHFQYRSQQLQEIFTSYYRQNEGWTGIGELVAFPKSRPMMMGRQGRHGVQGGMVSLFGILAPGERVRLVDVDGIVLVDSLGEPGRWNQSPVAQERLRFAAPIIVDKQVAGYLLWDTAEPTNVLSLEREFIDSLIKTTLAAVLIIGLGAALGAGRVAAKLIAPLEALTKATRSYVTDRILQPVPNQEGSIQEVEVLTQAFNHMINQLNENERLRRQLMADIAHELRTPLSVLRCNLEALSAGITAPNTENLVKLEGEVDRLGGLVEELQELSLLEQKKLPLTIKEENLVELVQYSVDFFMVEASRRGIKLGVATELNVALAKLDSRRFTQIMVNLLVNAFRHVANEGIIQVVLQSAPDSSYWEVQVKDNGPGIPPEDLPYVFERFYKSDKARHKTNLQEGAGLGLAIVKALVEAHGGKIRAYNQETGGAIFTIQLPR